MANSFQRDGFDWVDGVTPITDDELNVRDDALEDIDDRVDALEISGGATTPIVLTAVSGVITPDTTEGSLFRHTASANVTLASPTGGVDGRQIVVEVFASGGDRVLTLGDSGDDVTIAAGTWWIARLIYHTVGDVWVLDESTSGASGASGSGAINFRDADGTLRGQIISVSGDLWTMMNARWDATAQEFYRIDKTRAAFGWQMQGQGLIPGEPELGYNVAGATMWVASPAAYDLIRNGGSSSNQRFGGVGGWELGHTLTQEKQFTVGGMGIEMDGSGTFPYSRVVHSTTGTNYARRLSGGMHNTYPDLGGRDDVTKPGWFWGWNEQYNISDRTTVAGTRKWVIAYLPAGGTGFLTRFSVDESGTVSADNLHADSALCVGYPDLGGGATVLGVQNASTVPTTNPSNGAIVYAEGGELRVRGAAGSVTNLTGELVHAVGNSGSTRTLDASSTAGAVKTVTLTANCTFTLTGAISGRVTTLELYLTQDGTGGRTVTWPASVKWDNGSVPTLSTTAGATDCVVLRSVNGGTTWLGNLAGKGYS